MRHQFLVTVDTIPRNNAEDIPFAEEIADELSSNLLFDSPLNGIESVHVETLPEETVPKPYDVTGAIIAYECGELSDDEALGLFQHLVDTGLAWSLQGSYGRVAQSLLDNGLLQSPRRLQKGC